MNGVAVCLLAIAIVSSVIIPASAQSDGVPVKGALVVIADRESEELQRLLDAGGTPSNVEKMLSAAQKLLSSSAFTASTGTDGRFNFKVPLPPGTYNASIFAPGYVMSGSVPTVTVDAAGRSQNMTVFMQPSAVLSGKVTDSDGKPLSGIIVAAGSRHSSNYDVTMDDGVFVLDTGLKTGTHKIFAFKPALTNASRLQDLFSEVNLPIESRVPSFIGSSSEGYVGFSSTADLEQGKLTILNIELADSSVISGQVTDSKGQPVPGVAVLAFRQGSDDVKSIALTDANGNYALQNDIAPGQHRIIVPSIFSRGFSPFEANLTVPADNELDIALQNSTAIGGRVVDADGDPVAGAKITAIDKRASQTTSIQEFLAGSISETTSSSDGSFTINRGLANATYIATASFGDVPVASSVELDSGQKSAQIELQFTDVISIRGTIRDPSGIPIENASIAPGFASVFAGADSFSVASGSGGRFVLTAPTNGSNEESLYDEVIIAAPSYQTAIAQVSPEMNVTLNKIADASIEGSVIAQKSTQPPIEIALSRQGTMVFAHNGTEHRVGIHTNSRVIDATFDQPGKRIEVRLEGVQGSAGMSELAVPKDFLGGPFVLRLDDATSNDFTMSENQTHTVLTVAHEHGLQEMALQGTTVVPEFPAAIVAAAIAVMAGLAYRRLKLT